MRLIKDWFFSILTLVVFGLTFVYYDIKGRLALRRGPEAFDRTMATLQRKLIDSFRISGVKVTIEGLEKVDGGTAFIFVSNHQSMFDVPIFGGLLPGKFPKYVAKASLAKGIPAVSLNLRSGGNALIDRGDRAQALEAIAEMGRTCEQRQVSAVIFPEGTRSRDGSVGEYRVGGLEALMDAAPTMPVVPIAIDGSWKVFENNMFPIPYGTPVRVSIGEPIERATDEDPTEILDICRSHAVETLAEWASAAPDTLS